MMNVRVLLFASYADAFGTDAIDVEIAEPGRVRDVLHAVQQRAPGPLPPSPMMAVNSEYATLDQVVSGSDEVAIIPPVAGG
jgi:molybdopterin synthase sulfur carrier subunit